MSKQIVIVAVIWIIAMIVAVSVDAPLSMWVHDSGLSQHVAGKWWAQVMKEPGNFRFTLAVVAVLAVFRQIDFRRATFIIAAGVVSGANVILKWMVGRYRPFKFPGISRLRPFSFHPCSGGLYGLFHQHDLSFPSGHTCTAAALATAMIFAWPRGTWGFVLLATCVAVERPLENAHFASDVIAAGGFALLCTWLLHQAWSFRPLIHANVTQ